MNTSVNFIVKCRKAIFFQWLSSIGAFLGPIAEVCSADDYKRNIHKNDDSDVDETKRDKQKAKKDCWGYSSCDPGEFWLNWRERVKGAGRREIPAQIGSDGIASRKDLVDCLKWMSYVQLVVKLYSIQFHMYFTGFWKFVKVQILGVTFQATHFHLPTTLTTLNILADTIRRRPLMPSPPSASYSRLSIEDGLRPVNNRGVYPSWATSCLSYLRSRFKYLIILALLLGLIFKWSVETHIELAFYKRGWISELLPPDPPPLSGRCFSSEYLNDTFSPGPKSFPSSPDYNLTLGTLGLHPKVLSLSPGFDLPHHDDCYRFATSLPSRPTPMMTASLLTTSVTFFHLYWRSDLSPISERQIITLQSLLATQDFSPLSGSSSPMSHLILWTNPSPRSLDHDPLLAPLLLRFHDRLSLKVLDLPDLTSQTPMHNSPLLNTIFDKRAWLDGDLVRVLVLWRYGGYWVDMDNLVLRDLRVLGEHEWVVMWDCYGAPCDVMVAWSNVLFVQDSKMVTDPTIALSQTSPTSLSTVTSCTFTSTHLICVRWWASWPNLQHRGQRRPTGASISTTDSIARWLRREWHPSRCCLSASPMAAAVLSETVCRIRLRVWKKSPAGNGRARDGLKLRSVCRVSLVYIFITSGIKAFQKLDG